MRISSTDQVLDALLGLIARTEDGGRLPTVRELMRDHRASQTAVQTALESLRGEGLVRSHVGRGTYVVKRDGVDLVALPRSVLILSNASINERSIMVQDHISAKIDKAGGDVVQMSYRNTGQLLDILEPAPRFDAAILQSHFESIPVRLLSLLKAKARALVVDGHSISGIDIDRVGTDWEEALDMAVAHLAKLGHREIALISPDIEAQPILSARRAFRRIAQGKAIAPEAAQSILIAGIRHPSQSIADRLEQALATSGAVDGGQPSFTAVILLGMSDGVGLRQCLDRLGLRAPEDLSVYLLGHHDVPSEHQGVLTMAGSSASEAAEALVKTLHMRLRRPDAPPLVAYLETAEVVRRSTAAPRA